MSTVPKPRTQPVVAVGISMTNQDTNQRHHSQLSHLGFSLIEVLLYIALLSVVLVGAVQFAWNLIFLRERAAINNQVTQEVEILMARMKNDISSADQIISATGNQLIIRNGGNLVTYSLVSGNLQFDQTGQTSVRLNSNKISVQELIFTEISPDNLSTQSVDIQVTAQSNTLIRGQSLSVSTHSSAQPRAMFNQSRQLLLDLTQVNSALQSIDNLALSNLGGESLSVGSLQLSWEANPGLQLTQILVDTNPLWNGASNSGETITFPSWIIESGVTNNLQLLFNNPLESDTFSGIFSFADQSDIAFTISLTVNPSPTPTATPVPSPTPVVSPSPQPTPSPPVPSPVPTPTPVPTTCLSICQQSGFSSFVCEKNTATCTKLGGTHSTTGDIYCTGGVNADTCCCL